MIQVNLRECFIKVTGIKTLATMSPPNGRVLARSRSGYGRRAAGRWAANRR